MKDIRIRITNTKLFLLFVSVVLRKILQQHQLDQRLQEQQQMRHQQKEPNRVQSVPVEEVRDGRYVEERFQIRQTIELVQDPLSSARATTETDARKRRRAQRTGIDAAANDSAS